MYLIKKVSDLDIFKVLLQLNSNKVLSPDSYPTAFFQHFWQFIRQDVLKTVKAFFSFGIISTTANYAFIRLVSKVDNPTTLTQLRPISLCSIVYKIIAKMLANRLRNRENDVKIGIQAKFYFLGHFICIYCFLFFGS